MFEEGQEILDKRYRVIKKLGGGAFGEIFKGKQNIGMPVTLADVLLTFKIMSLTLKHQMLLCFGLILKLIF